MKRFVINNKKIAAVALSSAMVVSNIAGTTPVFADYQQVDLFSQGVTPAAAGTGIDFDGTPVSTPINGGAVAVTGATISENEFYAGDVNSSTVITVIADLSAALTDGDETYVKLYETGSEITVNGVLSDDKDQVTFTLYGDQIANDDQIAVYIYDGTDFVPTNLTTTVTINNSKITGTNEVTVTGTNVKLTADTVVAGAETVEWSYDGTGEVSFVDVNGDALITADTTTLATGTTDVYVKGLTAGTVTVTATVKDDGTVGTVDTATFDITVNEAYQKVTDITGVATEATAGTDLTLAGTIAPANATNQTIVWTVKDAGTTGATVVGNTLSTTGAGEVVVTATVANGETETTDYIKDFTITVNAATTYQKVTDITGVATEATAGTDLTLAGTIAPANATNQTIVWTVKDAGTTGATVAGNTLSTTGAGEVVVTATVANGETETTDYTKDFTITVNAVEEDTTKPTFTKATFNINDTTTAVVEGTNTTVTATAGDMVNSIDVEMSEEIDELVTGTDVYLSAYKEDGTKISDQYAKATAVNGKVVTFVPTTDAYKELTTGGKFTYTLAENSIADLAGNKNAEISLAVTFEVTPVEEDTTKPTFAKATFNINDGTTAVVEGTNTTVTATAGDMVNSIDVEMSEEIDELVTGTDV